MNKHIYKVIKWLEDPESVSQEEREDNREEAGAALDAAYLAALGALAYDNDDADLDALAYYAAYYAAYAALYAAINKPEEAGNRVNSYLEETGESKQDYLDAIKEEK